MTCNPSTPDTLEVSLMELHSQRELILALKEEKEKQKYTITKLYDEILLNGDYVSETTLKRVFRPGSEDDLKTFNQDNTLLPIAKILLPKKDDNSEENSHDSNEVILLRMELRVQAERVQSLLDRNEILEKRVDFMQSQIMIKDRRLDEREEVCRKVMAERDALRERLEAIQKE